MRAMWWGLMVPVAGHDVDASDVRAEISRKLRIDSSATGRSFSHANSRRSFLRATGALVLGASVSTRSHAQIENGPGEAVTVKV